MDGMPDKKFMVWTLVPLHRLSTTTEQAARAYEFVQWVKEQWLTEDGNHHPNIYIFNFFSLAAEMNTNPTNGKQYCLKYDYEYSHTSNNSHPNTLANTTIGPLFAQEVVKALSSNLITNILVSSLFGAPSITTHKGTLQLSASVLPADARTKNVNWSVVNITGKASISASGLVTAEKDVTVKAIATGTDGSGVKGELLINISNQIVLTEKLTIIDSLKNDTINGIGTKVSMDAIISPINATNQTVTWSVENLTGQACIDTDGLLTTYSQGTIKVIAKANDESNIITKREYLIAIPNFNQSYENSISFKVFSIPSERKIRIHIDKMPIGKVSLAIINLAGKKIIEQNIYNPITECTLYQYQQSLYFISLKIKNMLTTKKIFLNPL